MEYAVTKVRGIEDIMIEVNHISKDFKIYTRPKGFMKTVKSAFHREYQVKQAVHDISFQIERGEIVGYVGPNGSGKSTTIKMLSGILTPSAGDIVVDGIIPYQHRMQNAKNIGVVFGQRSQLYWDLPVRDSFVLHEKMYEIPEKTFKENVGLFTEVLQMQEFIDQPVRQLSLGQKMRANIAIALLHNPQLVYLDEPTIGLDIVAKAAIREFILEMNRTRNTTVIITTHDMSDIEQVCHRLILIDKGKLCYDGTLKMFKEKYGDKYIISVQLKENAKIKHPMLQIIQEDDNGVVLQGDKTQISITDAINFIAQNYIVSDIEINDSNIESILRDIYTGKIQTNIGQRN
jgi:ABC-2 type transport system ATP-binding protein